MTQPPVVDLLIVGELRASVTLDNDDNDKLIQLDCDGEPLLGLIVRKGRLHRVMTWNNGGEAQYWAPKGSSHD